LDAVVDALTGQFKGSEIGQSGGESAWEGSLVAGTCRVRRWLEERERHDDAAGYCFWVEVGGGAVKVRAVAARCARGVCPVGFILLGDEERWTVRAGKGMVQWAIFREERW
jgi:hypothetical protein